MKQRQLTFPRFTSSSRSFNLNQSFGQQAKKFLRRQLASTFAPAGNLGGLTCVHGKQKEKYPPVFFFFLL